MSDGSWLPSKERPLMASLALIVILEVLAVVAAQWASGNHGTHCLASDPSASARSDAPFIDPIIVGCLVAAGMLAALLLYLSRRRRELIGATVRVGYVSTGVAIVAAWCAWVYTAAFLGSGDLHSNSPLQTLPAYLLAAVGAATIGAQYLLLVPAPVLMLFALTRRSRVRAYSVTQITLVYGLLGCIAVAVGCALLLTGFCLNVRD